MSQSTNGEGEQTKKPMTLQETEAALSQGIFNLGRARYERMVAETREQAMADKCGQLAIQANDLRAKIAAEIKSASDGTTAKPALSVVTGGSAPDGDNVAPKA